MRKSSEVQKTIFKIKRKCEPLQCNEYKERDGKRKTEYGGRSNGFGSLVAGISRKRLIPATSLC